MNHFIRSIFTGLLFFILPLCSFAENSEKEENSENQKNIETTTVETASSSSYHLGSTREFASLGKGHFSSPGPKKGENVSADTAKSKIEQRAHSLLSQVQKAGNFIQNLDSATMVTLPVGITCGKGASYAIIIEKVYWEKDQAYLEAFMSNEIPATGEKIAFHSDKIPFSMESGIYGTVKMDLVSSHEIGFGDGISLNINSGGKTYVTWDCEGFKNMQVSGAVEFSRNVLVPENKKGEPKKNGQVRAQFTTNVTNWNNMLVELSLDPFQIKGVKGLGFYVNQAVLDYSDFANPGGIKWPKNYLQNSNLTGSEKLWRGIFIREASIKLPPEFENKDGSGRFVIDGKNIIIDSRGFSGKVSAKNVFTMNQGKMDKWAYSLEQIGLTIQANQIKKASFSGMMNIPALDKNSKLSYSALINPGGKYLFSLSPEKKVNMSIFAAKAELYKTSRIEVTVKNHTFIPKAILNGKANIQPDGKDLSLANIEFQELAISSRAPHFKVAAFSFGSEAAEQAMQGFPLSINDVGLKEMDNNRVGLGFSVMFHLVNESDGGFAASADLTVVGELGEDEGIQSWNYKHTHLSEATIDVSASSLEMRGTLVNFEDHSVYGSGFQGSLELKIIDKFTVSAMALFGKVNDFRYWYADALLSLPSGPTVGPLEFNKFGGGAFYHMSKLKSGETHSGKIGKTSTGVVYTPDKSTKLGVKARVGFRIPDSEKVFNGDATFEVTFNGSGGIRTVAFRGNGYFMAPEMGEGLNNIQSRFKSVSAGGDDQQKLEKSTSRGQLCAHLSLDYSVPEKTIHGNLSTYVNVGGGLLTGVGPGGLAGEAVLHFDLNKWYIHIGSPSKPIGIKALKLAKFESYLMVGDEIPPAPPAPKEVSRILGDIDLSYMDDENALSKGKGFAFGSSFDVNTGDMEFLMFYGKFAAGLGFDIMLKEYRNMSCAGRSGEIGVNGWYANGQAYGYFEGNIGIKVKIFGKKHKKDILDIGAAAIVQAKLPNPSWMKGVVGGHYSILGGMVKGNCKFEVELGEECEMVQGETSVVEGLETISQLTPTPGKQDVSVFNTPQAVFNMPINEEFKMMEDGRKKSFRIKLEAFTLEQNDTKINTTREWNDEHTVLSVKPFELLPGKTKIKGTLRICYQERKGGVWQDVIVDGNVIKETRQVHFTTGTRPDHIPERNVTYSYPVNRQMNFYKNISESGYIQLEQGQQYLFADKESLEWKKIVRLIANDGEKKEFDYTYNSNAKKITFDFPDNIKTDQVYKLALVKIPQTEQGEVDRNVDSLKNKQQVGGASSLEIKTQYAEGDIGELKEKVIYKLHFRSSKYASLQRKINDFSVMSNWRDPIFIDVHALGKYYEQPEMFDKYELSGNPDKEVESLIQFKADLTNTKYYNKFIKPDLYDSYPIKEDLSIEYRDPDKFGVPPEKAFTISQGGYAGERILTQSQMKSGSVSGVSGNLIIKNRTIYFFYQDLINLQGKAANFYVKGKRTQEMLDLINMEFPVVRYGKYPLKINYMLPGKEKPVKTIKENMYNPVEL